jgi:excisionase family DNA binding protein
MNAAAMDAFSRRLPDQVEIENADELRQIMASIVDETQDTTLEVVRAKGQPAEPITLTPAIAKTFLEVLRLISSGSGFRLIPVTAELTTQQAADLLNVSRPFLIKLLEEGKMVHHKVGRHR